MLASLSSVCSSPIASFPLIPVIIIFSLFIWLVSGWLLYRIGKKLGYKRPWYAWIPFLFLYMMVELSDQEKNWFWIITICAFIPCISIIALVMYIIVVMDLTEKCGKPRWWGILWLIPIVIWVVMFITGSGEAPAQAPSPNQMPPSGE
jgi:hypothetical protein